MLIDAHTHIWRAVSPGASGPVTTVSSLCDVPLELLIGYMDEYGVDRAVLVQPLFPGEDNSYVAESAQAHPDRFTAVCVVDPRTKNFEERLSYWVGQRGCRGLRLRPFIAGEEVLFRDPAFSRVWENIAELKTVVNVLIAAEQLPLLETWVERFPQMEVLIDHIGYPQIALGTTGVDFESLGRLARFPNVSLKVSGYYYFSNQRYPFADCWDIFRAIYHEWGPERLIWGSDFPHVLLKCGYRPALLFQERFFDFLGTQDLSLIMGGNALRLYWKDSL